ncbi:signal peptidase II [Candidatus Pelagibacter sp.]|jgi:signal peptidase II|nr:signal peptidase II [Candidatus Pelagibacter sp.]
MILKKNYKKFFLYFISILFLFLMDRFSKLYILNIAETFSEVDIYVSSFLNLYLVWNKGIGFGLFSSDHSMVYNSITTLIFIINIIIVAMLFQNQNYKSYFLILILGGSTSNLFDRLYYSAVPDFIDFHINNFHWFIFNLADIYISIGIICLIIDEVFVKKKEHEKN